jgi:uncharacterized protein
MSESTTARLDDEKFLSLATFKRNGDAAASPMWIVPPAATPPSTWSRTCC